MHVRSAFALSGENVAVVVDGTTRVTVARLAAVLFFRQTVSLRHALVAIASHDQPFARAVTEVDVASEVVDCSKGVARASLATFGVAFGQIPEAFLAVIATTTLHVGLAVTSACFNLTLSVRNRVTNAIVEGTDGVAVARLASIRALDIFVRIAVEERNALFAVLALSVVLAVIANSATDPSGVFVDGLVEVAADCVVVAVAFC